MLLLHVTKTMYNGKFGEYYIYLATEPFEIWRLRRDYYGNDVASTGKL